MSYTRVFSSASEPAPGRIHRRSQRPSEPFMSSLNHFGEYPQRSLSYHSMLNFFRLSGSPMKTKRDSQIRFHPIRDQHGWSRIRTCEGSATRFTVWPLWPLGYPPAWALSREKTISSLFSGGQEELIPDASHSSRRPLRAGGETRTHNPRFTKPKLCRKKVLQLDFVVGFTGLSGGSRRFRVDTQAAKGARL